jgi:hypothetical protein
MSCAFSYRSSRIGETTLLSPSEHAAARQEDSVLLSASTVKQLEFYFLDSVMIFPSRPLWKIVTSMK